MISCSVLNGNENAPISHFDCLANDIPFLPRNRKGLETKDLDVEYTQSKNNIEIKSNDYINKIKFKNLTSDVYSVIIKSITIFFKGKEKDINYTYARTSQINPATLSYMNGANPFIYNRELNINKDFLYLDLSIPIINEKELIETEKYISENGRMEYVNKIYITLEYYNKNNEIINTNEILMSIDQVETNVFQYCNNYGYPYTSPNDISCFSKKINNGSIAFIIDTKEVYKFNAEYDIWTKI